MPWSPSQNGFAGEQIRGIWGATNADIWAVGDFGGAVIFRLNGPNWQSVTSPVSASLNGVFGVAANDIWAVGTVGTLIHWDGASWSDFTGVTSEDLHAVFGNATDDFWGVGSAGTILHWDGATWTDVSGATAENLRGIFSVWAVGANGTTLFFDGVSWAVYVNGLGLTSTFNGISGRAADDMTLVGDAGVIANWDGAAWAAVDTGLARNLSAVWANPNDATDAWVVGTTAPYFMHVNGSDVRPAPEDNGFTGAYAGGSAVYGFSATEAWAAGDGGGGVEMMRWTGGGSPTPVDPTIQNVSEAGSTQTPFSADVVLDPGDGEIERLVIWVAYDSLGTTDAVYTGDALTADYSGASSVTEPSPGTFHLSVIRNGGWPAPPRIFIHANTDRGGMTR